MLYFIKIKEKWVKLMGELQKDTLFLVAVLAIASLLLAWYVSISWTYPYYFIWDMDLTAALDTVLIHSGLLPDHIVHPAFGMYLPLCFSEKIASCMNTLSILNLKDIEASLNPLTAMAELTDFIRLHSPFLAVGIVVLLALALRLIVGRSRWHLLLFLGILGTQESLTYHSSMVRTELYSIFYWSCAVLAMISAAKTTHHLARGWLLFLTGLLSGLSFLSKAQSFLYLITLMVLLFLVFSIFKGPQEKEAKAVTKKGLPWMLMVSLMNLIIFSSLCIASGLSVVPKGIPMWASGFGITPLVMALCLALFALFLRQLYLYLSKRSPSDSFNLTSFLNIIASGFIASFALYFLLYPHASTSLRYLLVNFKIIFFSVFSIAKGPVHIMPIYNFVSYLQYNPVPIIISIFLILLLILGYRFRFVRITKRQLLLCLLAGILAVIQIMFGARSIVRDIIWRETLLNFINLFYFTFLTVRTIRYRRILSGVCFGLFTILLFVNLSHTRIMPKRIDANFNHYGWRQYKWFENVYNANELKYRQIMEKKYNEDMKNVAMASAINHRGIKRAVSFVFKNQSITHKNIGIVSEGFPAWVTDLGWKIAKVPSGLRDAILVDNSSLKAKKKSYFLEEHVRNISEYMNKLKKAPPDEKIVVLTRADLEIFLFVHAGDIANVVSEEITKTPYRIALQKEDRTIILQGLEIKNYSEILLEQIRQKFFFVVRGI